MEMPVFTGLPVEGQLIIIASLSFPIQLTNCSWAREEPQTRPRENVSRMFTRQFPCLDYKRIQHFNRFYGFIRRKLRAEIQAGNFSRKLLDCHYCCLIYARNFG